MLLRNSRSRLRLAVLCLSGVILFLSLIRWTHTRIFGPHAAPLRSCQSSEIAMGDWLRWPRLEPNMLVDPSIYPPSGMNLPSLLLNQRPPPDPVKPQFPVPAAPPASSPPTTQLIIVKSSPENVESRLLIRETWGDMAYWPPGSLIRFIVGSPASQQLLSEAAYFNDIIVHGEGDGYRNNTRKFLAGLAWAVKFLPSLQLLLFTDDDILLNPFATRYLLESAQAAIESGEDEQLLAGHLVQLARPVRFEDTDASPEAKQKWAVTERTYPADHYPDYISAGWMLMSARLLPDLLWAAGHVTPRLPLDDVYLGVLAVKLRLTLTSLSERLALEAAQVLENKPPELLLALHGYSGRLLSLLRLDWERLVRLHCDREDSRIIVTQDKLASRNRFDDRVRRAKVKYGEE